MFILKAKIFLTSTLLEIFFQMSCFLLQYYMLSKKYFWVHQLVAYSPVSNIPSSARNGLSTSTPLNLKESCYIFYMLYIFIRTEYGYLNFLCLLNLNALKTESSFLNGIFLVIHLWNFDHCYFFFAYLKPSKISGSKDMRLGL